MFLIAEPTGVACPALTGLAHEPIRKSLRAAFIIGWAPDRSRDPSIPGSPCLTLPAFPRKRLYFHRVPSGPIGSHRERGVTSSLTHSGSGVGSRHQVVRPKARQQGDDLNRSRRRLRRPSRLFRTKPDELVRRSGPAVPKMAYADTPPSDTPGAASSTSCSTERDPLGSCRRDDDDSSPRLKPH
jgi:hypothetical protein